LKAERTFVLNYGASGDEMERHAMFTNSTWQCRNCDCASVVESSRVASAGIEIYLKSDDRFFPQVETRVRTTAVSEDTIRSIQS